MSRLAVTGLVGVALGLGLGLALGSYFLSPPPPPPPIALEEDLLAHLADDGQVLARVGDWVVTRRELEHRWWNVLDPRTRAFHRNRGGVRSFLDQIIEEKMMAQEGIARGYLEGDRLRIDLAMTRDVLLQAPLLREKVRMEAFPEERLREWYEKHLEDYERKESLRARQIVVTPEPAAGEAGVPNTTGDDAITEEEARRKIEFLLERIEAGDDFAELARKYSEDSTARSGGDLGVFYRGQMLPVFEEVVFGLEEGEISEPIETRVGLHLVRVEEKTPEGPAPFEEVRDEILREIADAEPEVEAERYQAFLGGLREKYSVEILADEALLESLGQR